MNTTFRNRAAFGKRIEYYIAGLMLKDGLDVYMPLVDDDAIDVVVKRPDGKFVEVQIKGRSADVAFGSAGLFAGLSHELRRNYWFVFYSERMDKIWILSSQEFVREADQNKSGANAGKRNIHFNGRNGRTASEHVRPQFERYIAENFRRLIDDDPDAVGSEGQ